MLLLFDIDGTLIRCGGAGRRALNSAFERLLGIKDALHGVRLAGNTDPIIVRQAFELRLNRAPRIPDEAQQVIESYLEFLERELESESNGYQVLPGAQKLLERATACGRFVVGLATGNVEQGANLKLKRGALHTFFSFGGYGSDAPARADLVRQGIERGQALAQRRFGRRFSPSEVLVLGDTEHDVIAARAAGAQAIGVLEGCTQKDAMLAAKPDLVVKSLLDPRLWAHLNISQERDP